MSIYREYDIRGIVPAELNEETVTKIGFALAGKIDGEYVAVGYDARTDSIAGAGLTMGGTMSYSFEGATLLGPG